MARSSSPAPAAIRPASAAWSSRPPTCLHSEVGHGHAVGGDAWIDADLQRLRLAPAPGTEADLVTAGRDQRAAGAARRHATGPRPRVPQVPQETVVAGPPGQARRQGRTGPRAVGLLRFAAGLGRRR